MWQKKYKRNFKFKIPHEKISSLRGAFVISFEKRVENVPKNVPENRADFIVEFIKNNERATIPEIAREVQVNEKTIKRDIEKLKEKGLLKRIGPDKGGYWKIVIK